MKRLVSLMLALVLGIYSFGVLTYAEESEHVSGINELIVDEVGVERAFTYYSYDDEQLYMVKVYENRIDVLNADTLEITFSAERIKGEEEFLEKELKGYREYKQKVKYRMIPFVW